MKILRFINKHKNNIHFAYTLAEMLIVLVIISAVLISLPAATKKLFTEKDIKTFHGRFECYWDRTNPNNPVVKYYYYRDDVNGRPVIQEGTADDNKCSFVPPMTYSYILIHAVGGGGAGGQVQGTVPAPALVSAYKEYKNGRKDTWDEWFKRMTYSMGTKDVYSTMITLKQVNLHYGKSGSAGRIVSMFFPYIPTGNSIFLYPGRGGELQDYDAPNPLNANNTYGGDGGNSVVQVVPTGKGCDNTDANASCNIVFAQGGLGARAFYDNGTQIPFVSTIQLTGGPQSDKGISKYPDVIGKESGFISIIDKIGEQSKITENYRAGDGGNGANHYLTQSENQSGFFFHEFDNFSGTIGREQGVKWEQVSNKVPERAVYSSNCSQQSSGLKNPLDSTEALKITRSDINDITTQCVADSEETDGNPNNYYCSVGYMKRNHTTCANACETSDKGPCACYTFELQDNGTYSYTATVSNFPEGTAVTTKYETPSNNMFSIEDGVAHLRVNEIIPESSYYISCTPNEGEKEYGSSPCAGNNNYESGTCKATRGGDGAIVILW